MFYDNLSFLAKIVWLLHLKTTVESRVIEQWPVSGIRNEKPELKNYIIDLEHSDAIVKDWNNFYAINNDIKPVREYQTIVLTKNVPFPYPFDDYLAYFPEKNFPISVNLDGELPIGFKKIISIPEEPTLSYPVTKHHALRPHHPTHLSPFSVKYIKIPVSHSLPPNLKQIFTTLPQERSVPLSHHHIHYPLPISLNFLGKKSVTQDEKKLTEGLLEKEEAHRLNVFLLPFPVEKPSSRRSSTQTTEERKEESENHVKHDYYTRLKPQDARNRLYSVAHKLYNSLNEDKRPPQIVDYNHPIDFDGEHGEQ